MVFGSNCSQIVPAFSDCTPLMKQFSMGTLAMNASTSQNPIFWTGHTRMRYARARSNKCQADGQHRSTGSRLFRSSRPGLSTESSDPRHADERQNPGRHHDANLRRSSTEFGKSRKDGSSSRRGWDEAGKFSTDWWKN